MLKTKLQSATTRLLHGTIDVMEAASKKTTGILRAQVTKLEPSATEPEHPPVSVVPDPAAPPLPPDGPPV